MTVKSTRLRYVSSSDPSELEAVVQSLPFKVEIKSITKSGADWYCWFVLPDHISNAQLQKVVGDEAGVSDLEIEAG